jgi:hypothetical protein
MADDATWRINIELRAKTSALAPALKEASASLAQFKTALEDVGKTGSSATLTTGVKNLADAAREVQYVSGAPGGRRATLEWRLGGQTGPEGASNSGAAADGQSLAAVQASSAAAAKLSGAADEEHAAAQAQRDAAQAATTAAGGLSDAASQQDTIAQALAISAAEADYAWRRFSEPLERGISTSLADAVLGIRQRGGMKNVALGLEQHALSSVINNALHGLASVTIEPLFKSLVGMGGPIGGIANLLVGNSQAASHALFASSVATFTAAVGTFAAATGVQATAAGTATVGASANAVGTVGAAGGIFGGLKAVGGWITGLFEHGGIVPSARGGWAVPNFGGGMPAILHPREMVLPADISEGLQGMIRGGGPSAGSGDGGGDVHLHFYGPSDGASVAAWIAQAIGDNPAPMLRALRGTGFSLA